MRKLSEFEISNMIWLKYYIAGDMLQTITDGNQMITYASVEVEVVLK